MINTNSLEYRGFLIKKAEKGNGFDIYKQNKFFGHINSMDIDAVKIEIDFAVMMNLLNSNLNKLHVDYV